MPVLQLVLKQLMAEFVPSMGELNFSAPLPLGLAICLALVNEI